jgi:hypothetical protein
LVTQFSSLWRQLSNICHLVLMLWSIPLHRGTTVIPKLPQLSWEAEKFKSPFLNNTFPQHMRMACRTIR